MRLPNKVYFIQDKIVYSLEFGEAISVVENILKNKKLILNINDYGQKLSKPPKEEILKSRPLTYKIDEFKNED